MILSSQHQFHECVSFNEERQFVAAYKGLNLRSVYQPIFDHKNHPIGVEALVRIEDQQHKNVRPDHFFHSNEISLEDKINVERLSRAIHIRNFSNSKYRHLNLFLNVLPSDGEFFALENMRVAQLSEGLKSLNLQPNQVVMEVVELDSPDEQCLKNAMAILEANGYKIAIDDFGMHASNRDRVELIKPSIIKIDRSLLLDYMQGITAPMLSGIELAKKVRAKVVVEGIETEEQYLAMRALNVDFFQGYFLATPQPLTATEPTEVI